MTGIVCIHSHTQRVDSLLAFLGKLNVFVGFVSHQQQGTLSVLIPRLRGWQVYSERLHGLVVSRTTHRECIVIGTELVYRIAQSFIFTILNTAIVSL